MARPLIPFVQNGYYASRNWIPLVKGNGFTTSGGGEQEEVWETASGSVVTFDAIAAPLRQLSVAVEPVQNLHGYDNPWPAGGGVNKLQVTATTQTINGVTFTVNSDGSVNVNGTATANAVLILNSYDFDGTSVILNGCPSGGSVSTFKLDAFGSSGLSEDIGSGVTISTSGTRNIRIVVFSGVTISNKLFKPMIRLASVTDANFAPYSNICPITGWDSVTVNRTGVNVWDEEWELGGINNQNGTLWTATDRIRSKNFIPCLPNTGYYLKCPQIVSSVAFYDADNTFISALANFAGNATFTTPSNAKYIKFGVAGAYGPAYNNDISINYPATDTEYHAYQGNTYTIQLGENVYGGTLDVVNGKMTVETVKYTFNGTENWKVPSSIAWRGTLYSTGGTIKPNANNASKVGVVCDYFKEVTPNEAYSKSVGIAVDPNGYVFIVPTGESLTVDSFKAWLAEHNVTAVFPLATPFELTLTPEQISTLQGTNNVWSDAGDVTVEYRAQ